MVSKSKQGGYLNCDVARFCAELSVVSADADAQEAILAEVKEK